MNKDDFKNRAGRYISQTTGYKAFIPANLPPVPPIIFEPELYNLLSNADRAIGRLDGITFHHPSCFSISMFILSEMYARKEAVMSSQIEGTQASLIDIFDPELTGERSKDVEEVINYIKATEQGINLLNKLPVSIRLIKEIHNTLLRGVRGGTKSPGEFRKSQNWIGVPGSTLSTASYVPPPPHEMMQALDKLEKFIHTEDELPVLIKTALIHAQFEMIHPFLDGNGRIGRLLIVLFLLERGVLKHPMLYLSYFFKKNRQEYYDRLTNIHKNGDWEGWIKFFLKGVSEVSTQAVETAGKIMDLQDRDKEQLINDSKAIMLLNFLFQKPLITVQDVKEKMSVSDSSARRLISKLVDKAILVETTGYQRNRRFIYSDYFDILREGTEL